jgi:hypothetical protein
MTPFPESEYPSVARGKDKRESQRLLAAAPGLLGALRAATEFIAGHNECLDPANDKDWVAYCVGLHNQCKDAIAKAEGGVV